MGDTIEGRTRIGAEGLRWRCPVAELGFDTTAEVEPLEGVVGQQEALAALRFGLEFHAPGQNVYVRGLWGTDRTALVRRILEGARTSCPPTPDYAYARNFAVPHEPRLLTLPRGRGLEFRDAIDGLIEFVRKELPTALATDELRARRSILEEGFQGEVKRITEPFEMELAVNGLAMHTAMVGTTVRPVLLPVLNGEPAPPERVQQLVANGQLSAEELQAIQDRIGEFEKRLEGVALELQRLRAEHVQALKELVRGEVRSLLEARCRGIRRSFPQEDVSAFLDEWIDAIVARDLEELLADAPFLRSLRVNPVSTHRGGEGCPVVVETTPALTNLLGSIDRQVLPGGVVVSDHLMIAAGSLLRADGGYLVLEARGLLGEPGAWKALVRTLRTGRLEIVPPDLQGPWGLHTLKPEPIPLRVKVVLIGDPGLYELLDGHDPDFPQLFKVLADFEDSLPNDRATVEGYAAFLARLARDEGLPHFRRDAVGALAEHGGRIAGRNDRLTTRFGRLADLAREAAFLSTDSGEELVSAERVREAVRRTRRRADLPARRFRERIADGTIHIQTRGRVVGQVNGLAVVSAGPLTYGFPARITATIGAGHAGTINIEREAQLSGAIHTKGFYILGGLLRRLLRTEHPLAFSASIAFEQSYGGIDGDSASGAEMCCLLSALTDVPLRQDLAMTGAIDQHGSILPVGAVTEKIEGFFEACRDLGMTGTQGVLIPTANRRDLMLNEEVLAAVEAGRFHVHAVGTIHEALELLTGLPTGIWNDQEGYPEGSLLATAVDRAFEFWALASARPLPDLPAEPAADEEGPASCSP